MEKRRILLASPQVLGDEEKYVKEVFVSNWLAPLGPFVDRLEDDMKTYMGAKEACALASGTAAIHLALKLAGVKEEDIVFCSDLTFSASANPIVYQNAKPVFIDSDEKTFNMSVEALEKAFEKYTPKAVIVVHLYGLPANIKRIREICDKHNVSLIEDAAEALGTTVEGKFLGTFGDYNAISFNGNKIITTTGGGMLLTNDKQARDKALFWATQSREPARHYEHKEIGYNYRMSNVAAAIGVGQLEHIQDKIDKKTHIHNKYVEAFRDVPYIRMVEPAVGLGDIRSNYWLSVIELSEESPVTAPQIIEELEKHNIESRPVWKPMHLQPVFSDCDFVTQVTDGSSVSEKLFRQGVCMSSDTNMTDEEQDRVIGVVRGLFGV